MPRVSTIIHAEECVPSTTQSQLMPLLFKKLRPHEITPLDETAAARPLPFPDKDQERLQSLADSLRLVGQVQPLTVQKNGSGYKLIAGRRRWQAAKLIEEQTGRPFELHAIVWGDGVDSLRMATHENIKRRGLTPLQFAHMAQAVRERYGWTGTKEVAEYLGVSRAQISQHDKLLHKPLGMTQDVYDALLARVASGRLAADSAFYALTHVTDVAQLDRAEELAAQETSSEPLDVIPDLTPAEIAQLQVDTGEIPASTHGTSENGQPAPPQTAKTGSLSGRGKGKKAVAKKHLQEAVDESTQTDDAFIDKNDPLCQFTLFRVTNQTTSVSKMNHLFTGMAAATEQPLLLNFTACFCRYLEGKTTQTEVLNYWKRIDHLMPRRRTRKG